MTSALGFRAFTNSAGLPFAMQVDGQQEYLPQLRLFAAAAFGTDAAVVDSSASYPHNEMIFERITPSCYRYGPFSASAEQSASAGQAREEMPAEDMHRAVSKISRVYAEICETAERMVASSPRELGHGQEANGMSAGG